MPLSKKTRSRAVDEILPIGVGSEKAVAIAKHNAGLTQSQDIEPVGDGLPLWVVTVKTPSGETAHWSVSVAHSELANSEAQRQIDKQFPGKRLKVVGKPTLLVGNQRLEKEARKSQGKDTELPTPIKTSNLVPLPAGEHNEESYAPRRVAARDRGRFTRAGDAVQEQRSGSEPADHLFRAQQYEVQGDRARALDSYRAAATGFRKSGSFAKTGDEMQAAQLGEAKARDGVTACQTKFAQQYEYPGRGKSRVCDSVDQALSLAVERTRAGEKVCVVGKTVRAVDEAPKYNASAVQKEINKDKRIGGKEASAIHRLLQGRKAKDGFRGFGMTEKETREELRAINEELKGPRGEVMKKEAPAEYKRLVRRRAELKSNVGDDTNLPAPIDEPNEPAMPEPVPVGDAPGVSTRWFKDEVLARLYAKGLLKTEGLKATTTPSTGGWEVSWDADLGFMADSVDSTKCPKCGGLKGASRIFCPKCASATFGKAKDVAPKNAYERRHFEELKSNVGDAAARDSVTLPSGYAQLQTYKNSMGRLIYILGEDKSGKYPDDAFVVVGESSTRYFGSKSEADRYLERAKELSFKSLKARDEELVYV